MHYTAKYFSDTLPEWKRKRDPLTVRFIYRPVSFFTSAFCANRGIKANSVSKFSVVLGVIACIFLAVPDVITGIIGGILLNAWIILDCTDGNLARQVRKQAYGEFLDAMSSYFLTGFLFVSLGFRSYYTADLFLDSREYYILLGALGSVCANLMSLLYQKYILVSEEFGIKAKLSYDGSDSGRMMALKTSIDMNLSVGGVLPVLVLMGCILGFVEIIIILWTVYYIVEFIATSAYFVYKAEQYNRHH